MTARVLIVDEGTSWSTLCAARSLAKGGWRVAVGSPRRRGITASSRYVTSRHDVPSLSGGLDAWATAVARAAEASDAAIVFAGGDAEVFALTVARDRIPAVVPYPPERIAARAFDKLELTNAALRNGIDAPETIEAGDVVSDDGPRLVKSRWHWDPRHDYGATRVEASVETGRRAIAARVDEMRQVGAEPILQEVLHGDHLSLIVLRGRDGSTLASVYEQIDHRWPTPAGWTVRAHTLDPDDALLRAAERMLADLEWTGLVELEFIRPSGGVPKLIDFNGRYYGSMGLAVAAGVDLPLLWANDATGRPAASPPPTRAGVRFQRFAGDLRLAFSDRHGRARAVGNTLRYAIGATHSIFDVHDVRPAFTYLRLRV